MVIYHSLRAVMGVSVSVLVLALLPIHRALAQIVVGPNVYVSTTHLQDGLGEIWLNADPKDSTRLLGCGIVYPTDQNKRYTAAFLSTDRGQHWTQTLETSRHLGSSADPACTLGPNGVANHVALAESESGSESGTAVYRSIDGGRTWQEEPGLPAKGLWLDRESIIADATGGRYAGRIYVTGEVTVPEMNGRARNGMGLWTSLDGGVSFAKSFVLASPSERYTLGLGNSVILSDGILVALTGEVLNPDSIGQAPPPGPSHPNALLEVIRSTDGGETLEPAVKVADRFQEVDGSATWTPCLAVDVLSGVFKDRLYAVWTDLRTGHAEILLAISTDKGKTWSAPRRLNDVDPDAKDVVGPNVFEPNVAVTRTGTVGVTWYDRHGTPGNLGWYLHFRASLDGGETWLPSVRVSSVPNTYHRSEPLITTASTSGGSAEESWAKDGRLQLRAGLQGRQFTAGDYSGLAADAGGLFHPFWTDNRTGLPQIWTAAVAVRGTPVLHGDSTLAALDDVSSRVTFVITSARFDRATGTVSLTTQLKNTSPDTLHGPFKVRGLDLTSELADHVQAVNATNGATGAGAVWDYTDAVADGVLRPRMVSAARVLTFRLSDPRPLYGEKNFRNGLVEMPVLVLARAPHP
jgi:hypothetical protein